MCELHKITTIANFVLKTIAMSLNNGLFRENASVAYNLGRDVNAWNAANGRGGGGGGARGRGRMFLFCFIIWLWLRLERPTERGPALRAAFHNPRLRIFCVGNWSSAWRACRCLASFGWIAERPTIVPSHRMFLPVCCRLVGEFGCECLRRSSAGPTMWTMWPWLVMSPLLVMWLLLLAFPST